MAASTRRDEALAALGRVDGVVAGEPADLLQRRQAVERGFERARASAAVDPAERAEPVEHARAAGAGRRGRGSARRPGRAARCPSSARARASPPRGRRRRPRAPRRGGGACRAASASTLAGSCGAVQHLGDRLGDRGRRAPPGPATTRARVSAMMLPGPGLLGLVAAEAGERGGQRALPAGGAQAHVDLVEDALGHRRGQRRDQRLGQPGVVGGDGERALARRRPRRPRRRRSR